MHRGGFGLLGIVVLTALASSCSRPAARPSREPVRLLPLQVLADTGRSMPLAVVPPRAWFERVSRTRPAPGRASGVPLSSPWADAAGLVDRAPDARPGAPARPAPLDLPPPEARPEAPPAADEPAEALVIDDGLKPPIPIGAAPLRVPPARGRVASVEIDVRIDESGAVSDALWAGGSDDSSAVAATTTCALAMRFHPALQRGRPVAVWCRQRFAFGRGGARPAPDEPEAPGEEGAR